MINKPIAEKTIALPFSVDYYGNVTISTQQNKIWADRVRSIIGTMYSERVMHPELGTNVPNMLWDTSDMVIDNIEREIERVFLTQLPLLTLDEVTVVLDDYTQIITANIVYSLPNEEEATEVIGLANLSKNKPLNEENL
jgi:phage baseplate assembly protein W